MKRMKVAIIVTILVTLAYALMLAIIGSNNLSVEKELNLFGWIKLDLPFEVSNWWYLLLCPLIILFIVYGYSSEAIIGKEPEKNDGIERKFHTRRMLYFMNLFSGIIVLGFMALAAVLDPIVQGIAKLSTELGPVSVLGSSIILWFCSYIAISVWEEFFHTLGWNTVIDSEDNSWDKDFNPEYNLLLKLKSTVVNYAKAGIVKSFPLLVGVLLGFLVRFSFIELRILIKK